MNGSPENSGAPSPFLPTALLLMTIEVFVTVLLLLFLCFVAMVLIVVVARLAREASSDFWTTAWKQPPRRAVRGRPPGAPDCDAGNSAVP